MRGKLAEAIKEKLIFGGGELAGVEVVIIAALFKQRFVIALFHHVALLHHEDNIGVFDGGKTVCHDKARSALHQLSLIHI